MNDEIEKTELQKAIRFIDSLWNTEGGPPSLDCPSGDFMSIELESIETVLAEAKAENERLRAQLKIHRLCTSCGKELPNQCCSSCYEEALSTKGDNQ